MWVVYALLTALSLATSDTLTKRALASRDEYYVSWARLLFALPVLLLSLLFIDFPNLDRTFWIAVICAMPLEIVAIILYSKALKASPISITVPFLALSPVFLIVISNVILGEKVSLMGGAGILFMAIGSYCLNIHKIRKNILGPVRAIFRERGSVLMIIVAFIYSITATLGKLAIEHSSPIFFGAIYFILITLVFTPIALVKSNGGIALGKKDFLPLASIGFTYSLMVVFHMVAMSMTQVAYMISVKRTSLLFSIMFGHIVFKEDRIAEKALGGLIMLAGFVLIVMN